MAFYSHPHFASQRFATQPPHHHHGLGYNFNPYTSPFATRPEHLDEYNHPSHSQSPSLEDEERIALAHLRSIQRRREAEQSSVRREAAARLQAQQEREALIAKAVEIQRQREAAVQRAIEEQRRKEALKAAYFAHAYAQQQQQQQQYQKALIERERQEGEKRKYIEAVNRARARAIAAQHHHQTEQHALAKRNACARKCALVRAQASAAAEKDVKEKSEEVQGLEALNSLFGSLFGINFTAEPEKTAESASAPTFEKPIEKTAEPASTATKSADLEAASEQAFPEAINDILSHFLGLRVDPTAANKEATGSTSETPAAASSNQVPEGLNELLGQFGLVFEPIDQSEERAEATKPSSPAPAVPDVEVAVADPPEATLPPAPATATASSSTSRSASQNDAQAPLTAFLESFTDLPPFVRDILGNVELAFKEEANRKQGTEQKEEKEQNVPVQGKGKGVAPGEKKERSPAPAPAPVAPSSATPTATDTDLTNTSTSISQLQSIAHDLHLVKESFTFPGSLSFASSTDTSAPALLFNKVNSGYHAQTNKLLQLLLAADGVTSDGNKEVRRKRKEVVREVEAEIESLEKKKDAMWVEVRERREKGEESEVEDETSWSSCSSTSSGQNSRAQSVIDPEEEKLEHVEDVEQDAKEKDDEDEVVKSSSNDNNPSTVDAPKSFAEAVKHFESEHVETASPSTSTDKATRSVTEQEVATSSRSAAIELEGKSKKAGVTEEHEEEGYEVL